MTKIVSFDAHDADPQNAINAFLWSMAKVRALGLCPRTEHQLVEQLFRGEAKLVFYSSMNGVTSLICDDTAFDDDDAFETIKFIFERRKVRRSERQEAAVSIETFARHFAINGGLCDPE